MIKHLYLVGEIDEDMTLEVVKEINEGDWEGITEIHIWISTPGGYLRDCFGIIDLINGIKEDKKLVIKTFGVGEVVSSGFFLFLLGSTRVLLKNTRVYVHEHLTTGEETKTYSERIKDDINEKQIQKMYINWTAERLNITSRKAMGLLKKNKWLSLTEIQRYGIATNVTKE